GRGIHPDERDGRSRRRQTAKPNRQEDRRRRTRGSQRRELRRQFEHYGWTLRSLYSTLVHNKPAKSARWPQELLAEAADRTPMLRESNLDALFVRVFQAPEPNFRSFHRNPLLIIDPTD